MVHLILTGATGLVGSSVLAHILSLPASTSITRLSILARSPTIPLLQHSSTTPPRNTTTKIEVIAHTDYTTYPPDLLEKLKDAHAIIWAQGISQTEVDKETYVKITRDYPLAAAKAFAQGLKPNNNNNSTDNSSSDKGGFNFIYVSGEGATHHPGRFTQIFARVKGETELKLLKFAEENRKEGFNAIIARPGGVDGQGQPEVWTPILERRGWMWKLAMLTMLPVFRLVAKSMLSPTRELGAVLTELALREGNKPLEGTGVEQGWVVTNKGLRRMGGLAG